MRPPERVKILEWIAALAAVVFVSGPCCALLSCWFDFQSDAGEACFG